MNASSFDCIIQQFSLTVKFASQKFLLFMLIDTQKWMSEREAEDVITLANTTFIFLWHIDVYKAFHMLALI